MFWNHAPRSFRRFKKHEDSSCHFEAVEVIIILPAITVHISLVVHTLQTLSNVDSFDLFWTKVTKMQSRLMLENISCLVNESCLKDTMMAKCLFFFIVSISTNQLILLSTVYKIALSSPDMLFIAALSDLSREGCHFRVGARMIILQI